MFALLRQEALEGFSQLQIAASSPVLRWHYDMILSVGPQSPSSTEGLLPLQITAISPVLPCYYNTRIQVQVLALSHQVELDGLLQLQMTGITLGSVYSSCGSRVNSWNFGRRSCLGLWWHLSHLGHYPSGPNGHQGTLALLLCGPNGHRVTGQPMVISCRTPVAISQKMVVIETQFEMIPQSIEK